MGLEFSVEVNGDIARCALSGRLDSFSAQALQDELKKLDGQIIRKLIFMAGGLEYISSAGLRVILFAKSRITPLAQLYLIGAPEPVLNVFRISGIDKFISVRDTLDASDSATDARARQSFPAKKENLEAMLGFISDFAQKLGFDQIKLGQIRLACEEFLVNVINYAYAPGEGTISIYCQRLNDNSITIEIRDSGLAFDPLQVKAPNVSMPLEGRSAGGLGIFLAKKAIDGITYERIGNENILRMVKHA